MHFRCLHILTLLREFPSAPTISSQQPLHGEFSKVLPMSHTIRHLSQRRKSFAYYSASQRLKLNHILTHKQLFVNTFLKKIFFYKLYHYGCIQVYCVFRINCFDIGKSQCRYFLTTCFPPVSSGVYGNSGDKMP